MTQNETPAEHLTNENGADSSALDSRDEDSNNLDSSDLESSDSGSPDSGSSESNSSESKSSNQALHSSEGNPATYKIRMLMEQTRLVAADYHESTGHALAVTAELARFDAIDKLNLHKIDDIEGVDATNPGSDEVLYLIKGRVIFKGGKARQKLGQLNMDGDWTHLLMVIYDGEYQPTQIFKVTREVIEKELPKSQKDKRGSMTVAKYKAIGEAVWTADS